MGKVITLKSKIEQKFKREFLEQLEPILMYLPKEEREKTLKLVDELSEIAGKVPEWNAKISRGIYDEDLMIEIDVTKEYLKNLMKKTAGEI